MSKPKIRKCIFTGRESDCKTRVLPAQFLSPEDEIFNWANKVPTCKEYDSVKSNRLPDDLEMLANEYFHYLELARLRVRYYEEKIAEINERLELRLPKEQRMSKKISKDYDKALNLESILETTEKIVDDKIQADFEKSKKLWDK